MLLCSEPEAHGFYLRRGFADRKVADIDLRRWAPVYSGYGVFRLSAMVYGVGGKEED